MLFAKTAKQSRSVYRNCFRVELYKPLLFTEVIDPQTERGVLPTATEKFVAAAKAPVPSPSRMETSLLLAFATARSKFASLWDGELGPLQLALAHGHRWLGIRT